MLASSRVELKFFAFFYFCYFDYYYYYFIRRRSTTEINTPVSSLHKQVALLSQRGRAMLRVCQ